MQGRTVMVECGACRAPQLDAPGQGRPVDGPGGDAGGPDEIELDGFRGLGVLDDRGDEVVPQELEDFRPSIGLVEHREKEAVGSRVPVETPFLQPVDHRAEDRIQRLALGAKLVNHVAPKALVEDPVPTGAGVLDQDRRETSKSPGDS